MTKCWSIASLPQLVESEAEMKKGALPERLIVVGVLLTSVLVTILDFAGALDNVEWLRSRIPLMTLLAVSLITSSLYFDGDRLRTAMAETAKSSNAEVLAAIGADSVGAQIIGRMRFRWLERETEVSQFFDRVLPAATKDDLVNELAVIYQGISKGELNDGARVRFPWDVAVMAMDFSGRFVYHPNPAIMNTRPNQTHHPQILRERNGECFWFSQFMTPAFRAALEINPGDEFKTDRFTRVYYRQCRNLPYICIFESHLDVLYQLPPR